MRYRVKVHKKGIVVIPAEVRRKYGIVEGMFLELIEEEDGIKLIKSPSLEEAFGIDGEKALEVVKLIEKERKREKSLEVCY